MASIDPEVMLEVTKLSGGRYMIAQRGAANRNGFEKNALKRRNQSVGALALHRGSLSPRRQPGCVERFTGIYVSDSGNGSLVEQRRLDACLAALETPGQNRAGETVFHRLRTEMADQRVGREPFPVGQDHHPEPPRVGKTHQGAVPDLEDNMLVGRVATGVVSEAARFLAAVIRAVDHDTTRHAQMRDQNCWIIEFADKIFGAPPEMHQPAPFQPLCEIIRDG